MIRNPVVQEALGQASKRVKASVRGTAAALVEQETAELRGRVEELERRVAHLEGLLGDVARPAEAPAATGGPSAKPAHLDRDRI